MMDFVVSHPVELTSSTIAIIFILVLGYVGIEDALKHRAK
jgi:hypothetical protein